MRPMCLMILIAALTAVPARAATFELITQQTQNAIVMHGPIEREDAQTFDATVQRSDRTLPTVVTLSSNGGDVAAATTIGGRIYAYGYSTYTPDNAICASSCGLIWLAGKTRFASSTSHIGFHAAYDPKTKIDIPEAKLWILAYFKAIAIPQDFIRYVYARSLGQGMGWITQNDAATFGIAMTVTPSSTSADALGSTEFVDTLDEANGAYARAGRQGVLQGMKERYDVFDEAPNLKTAFRCFAYELAADEIDKRNAPLEGRQIDPTFLETAWASRIESLLRTLGYGSEPATKIINTWIRTSNNTIESQR